MCIVHIGMDSLQVNMVVEAITVPWRPLVSDSVDLIILAWRRINEGEFACCLTSQGVVCE